MAKKVLVVLSGCGVYDGSEIHESVLILLALSQNNIDYQCAAPNKSQYHVINHTTGEEMTETRNVLVESARIARGNILDLAKVNMGDYDGLVLPGGFGAAKNLTQWAFDGPKGGIEKDTKRIILEARNKNIPIAAFCMSPVVLAKAFEGSKIKAKLTVGTTKEKSSYEIEAINNGIQSIGGRAKMASVNEVIVDKENKIISSPCYMMEASISEINDGIAKAISSFSDLLPNG